MQSDGLIDYLNRVRDYVKVPKQEMIVEGIGGPATAYFLSRLHQLEKERPVLIVTLDQKRSDLLLEDIEYFFNYMNLETKPLVFPSWELLPYESLSPLNDISGERLDILNKLRNRENLFLVAPIEALMQTVVPRNILQKNVFSVKPGDELDRECLETCLAENGFSRSPLVENRCEFSARGDIVDFFQPGADTPVRIEFFGEIVESIRKFDVFSQITVKKLDDIDILPVREMCFGRVEKETGFKRIFKRSEELGLDRNETNKLHEKIDNQAFFPGIEFLASFFFNSRETVFDFLPNSTLIVFDELDALLEKSKQFGELIETEFDHSIKNGRIVSSPQEFYLSSEEFFSNWHQSMN